VAAGDDAGLRHTIQRTLPTTLVALTLLGVGALVPPGPRLGVWVAAVLIDYVGVYLEGGGWRVSAPGHFAERHGLVMIIAIGESVVSVAVAVSHNAIDWPLLTGGLLGIALAITLWRTYFNVIAVAAERRLRELTGDERTRMARDTFTYLHLPAVVGILTMAVGLRVMLGDVEAHGSSDNDVPGTAMLALYGGAALYLVTMAVLRWQLRGSPSYPRLVTAAWLGVAGAVLSALSVDPLVDIAVVTGSFLALVTFDSVRYGRMTRDIRLGEGV
jgi:low temperature requirement protein LtrA